MLKFYIKQPNLSQELFEEVYPSYFSLQKRVVLMNIKYCFSTIF